MNPLPIVTKLLSVLEVSATGWMLKRLLIVLSLLVLPHLVVAQETSSWIGQKVVTKYEYPITSWYLVVPTHGFHVYTVQRTSGDWLWVVSGSVKGWIPASQVVRFDQAIDFYTQEIKANPGNSGVWRKRGKIWREKKEYDKAIADYNEAIRLEPNDASSYINRGAVWNDTGKNEKAIADFNEVIRLAPKDAVAYNNRGVAWGAKTYYDKAIADFNEAIRLDPRDARAYNTLAWLWATCPDENVRDGRRAVELATRACNLSQWRDAYTLEALAVAYAEASNYAKAVEWQEKVNNLYTDEEGKKRELERLNLYKEKKPYRDED